MTDAELDAELAALTAARPHPRLADRVVRAIEAPPEPRRALGWPALATLGATVVLVLSGGITWRTALTGPWPQPAAAPAMPIASAIEAAPSATAAALSDDTWGRASALPSGRRVARTIREEAHWPYRLPALELSEPLAIAPIDRETIHAPRLGVEPLSIAQLEIESLER